MPPARPIIVMPDARVDELIKASWDHPHEARIYNYWGGGNANGEVDREFANQQITRMPHVPWATRKGGEFIVNTVRHMALSGITQVIDFGSGLPTGDATHTVLERYAGDDCHVIYVDHDPMAAAHSYMILEDMEKIEQHKVIQADVENCGELWAAILDTELIDPARPVGLLAAAVWHFLPDSSDPAGVIRAYQDEVSAGSQLALSHTTGERLGDETRKALEAVVSHYDAVTAQAYIRTWKQIKEFFGDWELVEQPRPEGSRYEDEPTGLVWIPDWVSPLVKTVPDRGHIDPSMAMVIGGLAEKR